MSVSVDTARLLVDGVRYRGLDPAVLWAGLPVLDGELDRPGTRITWDTWCAMMQRAEDAAGGPEHVTTLFVPGAGRRTNHVFVRVAPGFLSLSSLYSLFLRWGLQRTMLLQVTSEPIGAGQLRITIRIAPEKTGSAPTLRYIVAVLRHLAGLQGHSPADVVLDLRSDHEAGYVVTLPPERSWLARLWRVWSMLGGAGAALDELSAQSEEITHQNQRLEGQLAALRESENRLRERDQWLALALEVGRVGIWQWEAPDTIRWSADAHATLGLSVEGTPDALRTAVHPDDRARFDAAVVGLWDGTRMDLECRLATREGWVRLRGHRVGGEAADGALQALGTVMDVTDQRRADERLRFADRMISAGTLAAGVAHEVNNPLAAVLGNLDLLRHELTPHAAVAHRTNPLLDEVEAALTRIRDIVRDLRTFARPEATKVGPVDLRAVCSSSVRLLRAAVPPQVELQVDCEGDALVVLGNASQVGQVVMNLVLNATHAVASVPRDHAVVRLSVRRLGGDLVLEVSDNGPGVAPEVLPRLFEPFFTTKPEEVGTGLGLSICQRIVSAMGGRIEVHTELGTGTRFQVVFPSGEAATPPLTVDQPATSSPPAGFRVLVVDDEPMVRSLLVHLLRRRGFEVVTADGGAAALDLIAAGPPVGVIVCDLMMPGMSGAEVHARLAESAPELARRMVFVTGGAVSGPTLAFVDRPDILVVPKPLTPDELVAGIREVAER